MAAAPAPSSFIPPPPMPGTPATGSAYPGAPSPYIHEDHPAYPIVGSEKHASLSTTAALLSYLQPIVGPLGSTMEKWSAWRASLDLPNPGTVEHLQRETKSTLLTNFFFDGARADLTKALSINPIFQVTHAFSLGSAASAPSYNFGAVYGDEQHFLQGGLDDGGNVTVRANRGWVPGHTSKFQGQFAAAGGQTFAQLEHDYQGMDHSINFKALNPSPIDGSGIYVANYLQSLTRNFSLGIETVVQHNPDMPETALGYMGKWVSDARDAIATVQVQGQGILQATYWQRLSDKVDVAADLQCIVAGSRRDAQATLGAKWDFRTETLRAQIDSTGKVSSLFETRFAPTFSFTVGGEIDHLRSAARFGVGIALESAGMDMPMDPNALPPQPPSVPM